MTGFVYVRLFKTFESKDRDPLFIHLCTSAVTAGPGCKCSSFILFSLSYFCNLFIALRSSNASFSLAMNDSSPFLSQTLGS